MYTAFYKLDTKPFQISSDPEFLWLGEKHKEALATLKYGVLDNKGFLLLTGDVGTGKTTLIHSLIESLSEDVIFASVPDPALSKLDFLNYIALEFGIEQEFATKGSFLVGFRKFLIKAYDDDKKVLLIIDEAQLLTQELLEEIRLLSNIEKTHTKLINIFFVGQNEFNDSLNKPQNRAVRQRLTLNYNIDPLTPDETDEYIKFRLKVAGVEHSIFEPGAVQEIFMYSGGFPRRINIICDHALLSGYVQDSETIGVEIIKDCVKDLKIPAYGRPREIDRFDTYPPQSHFSASPPNLMPPQRPVIIQPALPQKTKSNTFRNILIGTLGLMIVILLFLYFLFPQYFTQLTNIRGLHDADRLKTQVVKVFSKEEDQKKNLFKVPIKDTHPLENLSEKKELPSPDSQILLPPLKKNLEPDAQKKAPVEAGNKRSGPGPSIEAIMFPESEDKINESEAPPAEIPPLPENKIVVRFKYNTNDFTQQGFDTLQDFADILAHYPSVKVKISGYSDSAGYQNYNEKLSEFRANIVRSFLLGRGANPKQLEVQGLGSKNPIESNSTAWGRTMNRRVEIEIIQ